MLPAMNVTFFFITLKALMIDRMHYMIAVNGFWIFDMVFSFALRFLHEKTQKKTKVLQAGDESVLNSLQEFFDIENIPVYLGGKNEI